MNRRNILKSTLTFPLVSMTSLVGKEKFPTRIEVKSEDFHKHHIYAINKKGEEISIKQFINWNVDIDEIVVDRKLKTITAKLSYGIGELGFHAPCGVGWRRNRVIY